MDYDTAALIGPLVSDGVRNWCCIEMEHVYGRYWKYVQNEWD
jgi:hypothetical protein